MLKVALHVSKELRKLGAPKDLTIQQITDMFRNVTALDRVWFQDFDTAETNPIFGEFTRWVQQPKPYVGPENVVVIRYARHLLQKEGRLRFVITKELCHALEAPDGKHDTSREAIIDLVNKFSVISHQQNVKDPDRIYMLEMLAEIAAIEILFPTDVRKAILAKEPAPDMETIIALSVEHKFPPEYIAWSLQRQGMESIADLLEQP